MIKYRNQVKCEQKLGLRQFDVGLTLDPTHLENRVRIKKKDEKSDPEVQPRRQINYQWSNNMFMYVPNILFIAFEYFSFIA